MVPITTPFTTQYFQVWTDFEIIHQARHTHREGLSRPISVYWQFPLQRAFWKAKVCALYLTVYGGNSNDSAPDGN